MALTTSLEYLQLSLYTEFESGKKQVEYWLLCILAFPLLHFNIKEKLNDLDNKILLVNLKYGCWMEAANLVTGIKFGELERI